MFSICLFFACRCWNCSPPFPLFFSPLSCFLSVFFQGLEFAFRYFSKFEPPPLFSFGYRASMHPHSFSQRGASLAIGALPQAEQEAHQREKLKQYLPLFALLFFYCGNPEHTERTRSAAAEQENHCNVFPCDVTVNNFSAKGINLLTLDICASLTLLHTFTHKHLDSFVSVLVCV